VYVLNVVVTDFTGDLDLIFVPVLAALREHQPDIMTTDDGRKKDSPGLLISITTIHSISVSA
jgi:hypothetical protein